MEKLILEMYAVGMIKFGEFTLKSGKQSYIYADIRSAISYPRIFTQLCDLFYSQMSGLNYNLICGVPYSALTFASAIAYTHQIPMLLKRKEAKDYGTKKLLEGTYKIGDTCLLLEDVVTSGMSIRDTAQVIEDAGLKISDVVCFIDRKQGGQECMQAQGYTLHSLIDIYQLIDVLLINGKISHDDKKQAINLIGR